MVNYRRLDCIHFKKANKLRTHIFGSKDIIKEVNYGTERYS